MPLPDRLCERAQQPLLRRARRWSAASASCSTARSARTSANTASARAGSASPPASPKDRFGQPMTLKLKGKVEPYDKGEAAGETGADVGESGAAGPPMAFRRSVSGVQLDETHRPRPSLTTVRLRDGVSPTTAASHWLARPADPHQGGGSRLTASSPASAGRPAAGWSASAPARASCPASMSKR